MEYKCNVNYGMECNCDVLLFDWDVLQYAASTGDISLVKYIIRHGVNPHSKNGIKKQYYNPEHDTILKLAINYGHVEVARYLLEECQSNIFEFGTGNDSYLNKYLSNCHTWNLDVNFDMLNLFFEYIGPYTIPYNRNYQVQVTYTYKNAFNRLPYTRSSDALYIWFVEVVHIPGRVRAINMLETCSLDLLKLMHLKYKLDLLPTRAECIQESTCLHYVLASGNLDKVSYLIDTMNCWPNPDTAHQWLRYNHETTLCSLMEKLQSLSAQYPDINEYLLPKILIWKNLDITNIGG